MLQPLSTSAAVFKAAAHNAEESLRWPDDVCVSKKTNNFIYHHNAINNNKRLKRKSHQTRANDSSPSSVVRVLHYYGL